MENLQLSYPTYYLFFIVIVALIGAVSLYFGAKRLKETNTWLPTALGSLRFLSILCILFLLLGPLLRRFITDKQKPKVVLIEDKSQSIGEVLSSEELASLSEGLDVLRSSLEEKFEVDHVIFGENHSFDKRDTIEQRSTNISAVIDDVSEIYEDQNLSSLILISDGIYNEGKNPIYSKGSATTPISIVALGDTTIQRDLLIRNVLHNRIVYLNDKFKLEVDVQAYNANSNQAKVNLYRGTGNSKTLITSQTSRIDSDNFFETVEFELSAERVGTVDYQIEMAAISDELTVYNNVRQVQLEVLDARQKILVVSNAPHPDIKAIKQTINNNKNYELEILPASKAPSSINKYDVLILHDLPSSKNPVPELLTQIKSRKKPTLYIYGSTTDVQKLNTHHGMISLAGSNQAGNKVTPLLNSKFKLFTLDQSLKNDIESYVPLVAPFGDYTLQANAVPLLSQKIGTVDTDYPLLAYDESGNHKRAILAGEGIWKWRLYEYQEYDEYKHSESLLLKTIQYIATKEDKRQFRAYVNQNNFKENESVRFDAQLYNNNYEPINEPEASLKIENSNGEKFDFTFSKSNNFYVLDAGRFPAGKYKFTASTSFDGQAHQSSGSFSISRIIKEKFDLTARHDLLSNLAQKTGGEVYYQDRIQDISTDLLSNDTMKPILFTKSETRSILNDWYWLVGAIVLLAIEWFLRRYFGAY